MHHQEEAIEWPGQRAQPLWRKILRSRSASQWPLLCSECISLTCSVHLGQGDQGEGSRWPRWPWLSRFPAREFARPMRARICTRMHQCNALHMQMIAGSTQVPTHSGKLTNSPKPSCKPLSFFRQRFKKLQKTHIVLEIQKLNIFN